uniref:V-type proton ATPase subunit E 1 n=1 Tax=Schistosoma haematobium TaxID=6185 RepID=A0A094ZP65_SCHHA
MTLNDTEVQRQDSNLKNQSRLKVLQSRENHIEGLFQLLEPEVIIRCRQVDRDLTQNVLPECVAAYRKQTGTDCRVTIDNNYLPDSLAGGIEVYNKDGRIKVVNTLESRLDQISELLMPQLREILFGVNEGRKFRN